MFISMEQYFSRKTKQKKK